MDIFSQTDLNNLKKAIQTKYASRNSMALFLNRLGISIDDVAGNSALPIVIINTINLAKNDGWIVRLIEQIRDEIDDTHQIFAIISSLIAKIDEYRKRHLLRGGEDPLQALEIFNKPFINRTQLRKDLGPFSHFKIFFYEGNSASGKSYTYDFISHLSDHNNNISLKLIDLTKATKAECEPFSIVERLAIKMRLDRTDLKKDEFAQEPRVTRKLAEWFEGAVQTSTNDKEWWIGFDGLNNNFIGRPTTNFISNLANIIDDGNITNVKLFIFGNNKIYPVELEQRRRDTTESLPGIRRIEVKQHFFALADTLNLELNDADVDSFVDNIFERMPSTIDHENMEIFHERVSAHTEFMIGQASD